MFLILYKFFILLSDESNSKQLLDETIKVNDSHVAKGVVGVNIDEREEKSSTKRRYGKVKCRRRDEVRKKRDRKTVVEQVKRMMAYREEKQQQKRKKERKKARE